MKSIYYFDNGATTFPKPEEVYNFTNDFYRTCGVNVGRGQYKLASKASFLVDETRNLLLDFFNCQNKKVIFTSSATEGINLILQGLNWEKIKTVYLSPFEHNSITRTIHFLKNKYSIDIEILKVNDKKLEYDIEEIKNQFKAKSPDLVIISQVSNVCGFISPVHEIFSISKKYGAINIVDTCQSAGLVHLDLSSDIYDCGIFAGHKTFYGPLGVGGIIVKEDLKFAPLMYGGTGIESANQDLPKGIPERYEVGSKNILSIVGLNSALKWIKNISIKKIKEKEEENYKKLIEILKSYSNIKLVGFKDFSNNIAVVSCIFDNYTSDEIGQVLSNFNIGVRVGLHCSPIAHKFLGTFPQGTVRFSIGYFNDDEDFEELIKVLDYIKENS